MGGTHSLPASKPTHKAFNVQVPDGVQIKTSSCHARHPNLAREISPSHYQLRVINMVSQLLAWNTPGASSLGGGKRCTQGDHIPPLDGQMSTRFMGHPLHMGTLPTWNSIVFYS